MPQELNPNVQFRNLVTDMSDVIDEAILNTLDSHHPDDRVLASLAEARGGVVRMNHALKIVTIAVTTESHNEQLPNGAVPKPLPLPKLQKQKKPKHPNVERPGIKKLMRSSMDYTCPSCKAEPGTRCFVMTGPGHKTQPTGQRRDDDWTHRGRVQLASDHNNAVKARYDREHFIEVDK